MRYFALAVAFALGSQPSFADVPVGAITLSDGVLHEDGEPWIPQGFTYQQFSRPRVPGRTTKLPLDTLLDKQIEVFGADTVRFQVSQAALDPESGLSRPGFLDRVTEAVAKARDRGMAVILSMQWQRQGESLGYNSDPGEATERAWRVLAESFNHDLGVMYEIYNEPIGQGSGLADGWAGWEAEMERLITVVRETSSRNVLIVQGKNSGHILTGAPDLDDPLNMVAYAVHPYPLAYNSGYSSMSVADWEENFGAFCREGRACLVTEWMTGSGTKCVEGDTPEIARSFTEYLRENRIGMAGAWAFDLTNPKFSVETETFQPNRFDTDFACSDTPGPQQGPGELLRELWAAQ